MQQQSTSFFRGIINQFVTFQPNQENKSVHKHLELQIDAFTKTRECWEIILEILNTESSADVLSLASSILKNKFQYDFGQLTPQLFQKVHQSLIHIIAKFNVRIQLSQQPSNSVRFNLSVAVAIIYIHKASQIGQILNYLSQQFLPQTNRNYFFTVLEVLPEEIDNDKIVVDEEKRIQLRSYLDSIQKNVLVELNNISVNNWASGEIKHSTLLRCFSNWIRVGSDKEVIMNLHKHFLFEIAFNGLADSNISEDCVLCIQFVIRSIPNPQQYSQIYSYIAKKIVSFFAKIKTLLDDDCIEMCQEMIKLICIFGISSKNEFVSNQTNDYKQFINNVVLLTQVLQLQFAVFFQQFWIEFLSLLIENNQKSEFYSQSLKALYLALSKIVTFEVGQCEQLNRQSSNEYQKVNNEFQTKLVYRLEFKALFNLLSEVLVPETCLILSLTTINGLKSTDPKYWTQMQSYLNPLEQVIEQLSQPSQYLNSLVSKLVEIDPPYQTVKKTIIRILSASSKVYSKNNEFALKIFQHLIEHMKNPEMNKISSKAFENLCVYNVEFVLAYIDSFIQTLLVYKDNELILNGIIKVLKNNQEVFKKYIPSIFSMYISDLPNTTSIKQAKIILDRVVLIFDRVTQGGNTKAYSSVMRECFDSIWGMIKPILQKECQTYEDESLLQKCTKVIKYAMRCLREDFQSYIEDIYNVVIDSYTKYAKSSYVYMLEVLVTVYYDNPNFLPYIENLFDKILQITFTYLTSLDKIMELPKLAEDFFGLLSRILRFIPQVFFSSKHIKTLLDFIIQSCGIQDGEIARIFYNLLVDFYMQYWDRNLVLEYIEEDGMKDKPEINQSNQLLSLLQRIKPLIVEQSLMILQKIIQHLETVPSTTVRSCIVNVLLGQVKAFSSENRQLWIKVLTPIQEDILTMNEKGKILQSVTLLTNENIAYVEDIFYLMTKRYLHRLTRSSI